MEKTQTPDLKKILAIASGVVLGCAAAAVVVEWLCPGSTPLKKLRGYTPCDFRFEELEVEGDD